jgi:hypothetical protein
MKIEKVFKQANSFEEGFNVNSESIEYIKLNCSSEHEDSK